MASTESLGLVRFWVFEYAFKFRMKRLISALLHQSASLNLKCAECSEISTSNNPCLNNIYILNSVFCESLDIMVSLLQKPITIEQLSTVDTECFLLCSNMLEEMYQQQRFIRFEDFNKLQLTLKLVPLILLVLRQEDHNVIMENLNTLYPQYLKTPLKDNMEKFHISDKAASQLQFQERQVRMFILQLLLSKEKQDHYVKTRLVSEIKRYLESAKDILKLVISKTITPYMPKTVIEQMTLGKGQNYVDSTDPAIQLLLEFLQPEMQEQDLFLMLNVLNPNTPIQKTFNSKADMNLQSLCTTQVSGGEEKITSSLELENQKVKPCKSQSDVDHDKSWTPVVSNQIKEIPIICLDDLPDSSVSSTNSSPAKRKLRTIFNEHDASTKRRKYLKTVQHRRSSDMLIVQTQKVFASSSTPKYKEHKSKNAILNKTFSLRNTSGNSIGLHPSPLSKSPKNNPIKLSPPSCSKVSEKSDLGSQDKNGCSPVVVTLPDISHYLRKHLNRWYVKLSFKQNIIEGHEIFS